MPSETHRFPVMLWKTSDGVCAGRLLDADSRGAAVGTTPRAVLAELEEYVHYLARNEWLWEVTPDFFDAELQTVRVAVVPEYRVRGRTFPSKDPIRLRLPCAVGRREGGMLTAILPTVDVVFDFNDSEAFDNLVQHYVTQTLAGLAPRDIAPFLPPESAWLEELVVRMRPAPPGGPREEDSGALANVADHVGDREFLRTSRTWERHGEVADLVHRLQDSSASLCLVGPGGCGKTSIVIEAAKQIEHALRPKGRRGARSPQLFWMSSAGRLVAGMRFLGQWEERLEEVVDELAYLEGILCVENLLELVRLGGSGPETSLGAFLVPYLEHGELRLVAEATPEEVEACERLLPSLVEQLQTVVVEPLEEPRARRVLRQAAASIGRAAGCRFTHDSVDLAYRLFRRFQPYAGIPGRPIHFLSELADAAARPGSDLGTPIEAGSPEARRQPAASRLLEPGDTRRWFSHATGLPEAFLQERGGIDPAETRDALDSRVLGQQTAVDALVRAVLRFRTGMNNPRRPLGVLLFTGPTGVGKTAMARALGDFLFPSKPEKERLLRLDMSEYGGYDASRRLLGDPWGDPSELVRRIRADPFTVLLLDEIEKASEEVFDIFMNVFEEGRLTDTFGRVTSFHSAFIVMTSNVGVRGTGSLGFIPGAAHAAAATAAADESAVRTFFRPEFFQRIDEVVTFNPLPRDIVLAITRKELASLATREGMTERHLALDISEDVVARLAATGFDERLGARPLLRKIEEEVTTPVARLLTRDRALENATLHVTLDASGTVRVTPGPAPSRSTAS